MMDFALELLIKYSLSARRLCCLAFFARLGANLASLSTNASLKRSAIGNSDVSLETVSSRALFLAAPETAQVLGSMPSMKE